MAILLDGCRCKKPALPRRGKILARSSGSLSSRGSYAVTNFDLDSCLKDRGGSEKRGGARDGTSIMAARFESLAVRAGNGVFARARETICPSTDIRAASLTTRKERLRAPILNVTCIDVARMNEIVLSRGRNFQRIKLIANCVV